MADKKTKTGGDIHSAAKMLGSLGGKVGGKARAAALSPQQRKSIAKQGGIAKRDASKKK
jgi:hypothetical protein